MKTLTKAEEEIMQVLWQLGKGTVNEIIAQLNDPKPAYNTVSTVVRILENKGFVDHEPHGRGFSYFPIIAKETYSHKSLKALAEGYFQGSFKSMLSFFVEKKDIDLKDVEDLLQKLKNEK
ncbi:BlaI/MecI/CopY family transcriptional regulator [Capnocytophaga felis]|uniref:Transcriptional regulator n=1 Tax=Capnocytophaga felis TaxID=2267611 RepID=A0A5M4B7P8_9FLAO|nr:BlaI/MecI/CopY family transcriptional regulator [Capnocytophaga felis]GET45613.1 transcriptional regulator [Capnocytophaga felis]GET47224.1 transcriptional regulator [Capnocytophaga felis]